jgi:arginase
VPRAWGEGGEAMAVAAELPLPYPEVAVVAEASPEAQATVLARTLPERPLVLGGCCCAHVGAVDGLAARHGRVSVVWLDAHGDLNTLDSSPSGNAWATPLRTLLDSGVVASDDVALVGARALDPPEVEFIAANRIGTGASAIEAALDGTAGSYLAIDFDAFDASEVAPFMPQPGGLSLANGERLLASVVARSHVLGAGLSGLVVDERNTAAAGRLLTALSL